MKNNGEFSTPMLKALTVDCKDNGRIFTVTDRLDAIRSEMDKTCFAFIKAGSICRLYAKDIPLFGQHVVLVSSHIDCVFDNLFCREDEIYFKGTFDNSITNTALVTVMMEQTSLPCVVAAFTGDEENDGRGSEEAVEILKGLGCIIDYAICLDVTDVGWHGCSFTVENVFTGEDGGSYFKSERAMLKLLRQTAGLTGIPFCMVPEGDDDEAWDYDEMGISSFSLCIPSCGDMHSESGVKIKKTSYKDYCRVLGKILSQKL